MTQRRHAFRQAALVAAICLPALVPAAHAADWEVSGNAGLYSDYRFRGISQTNKYPALQGGFDFTHASGFYVGNWNSNIDSAFYNGANLEMDFYGGFRGEAGAFSYDAGVIYYYYPGSDTTIDNTELYIGGGWGPVALKYSHAVSDFFSLDDSSGSYYLDATVTYPLNDKLALVGHLGYQGLKGSAKVTEINGSGPHDSITDWKLGVTYDLSGWVLAASYIGTNRELTGGTGAAKNRDLSGDTVVVSVGKSF